MVLPNPSRRRIGVGLALAGAAAVLGAAPAGAEPAGPSVPRGYPVIVDDVLGPHDPGFWNPAIPGTRILTPVEPGVRVYCASGIEPPPGCSTLDMRDWTSPQRSLVPVDVPMIGGPPLRVWADVLPRSDQGYLSALARHLPVR
ncbi:MAG: hypothetical protein L0H59_14240 [Tomitella sp.]|nr:hypothetical protein [Tomitella sp.]